MAHALRESLGESKIILAALRPQQNEKSADQFYLIADANSTLLAAFPAVTLSGIFHVKVLIWHVPVLSLRQ